MTSADLIPAAVLKRKEGLSFSVVIKRMPLVADQLGLILPQRRNPMRVAAVDIPRQLQKLFFLAAGRDGLDDQFGHPTGQNKEYDGWLDGR